MTLEDWQDWKHRCDALAKLDTYILDLLTVDWVYSVLPIFEGQFPKDKRPRLALEAAEKYISSDVTTVFAAAYAARTAARTAADAAADVAAVAVAASAATAAAWAAHVLTAAASVSTFAASAAAANVIYWVACAEHGNWQFTYWTYLHALGPTDKTFNEEWLTPTVKSLVQTNDILLLPIIADSLEDAGCDNNDILQHLRSNPAFTRADWVWRKMKG